jgi:hypothetical protein
MMKVQGSLEIPQLSSPLLLTFSLYGESAGICTESPTVLPFLYGEGAGLFAESPTVLPLLLIFSLYLESAGLCTEGLTGLTLATRHLPV